MLRPKGGGRSHHRPPPPPPPPAPPPWIRHTVCAATEALCFCVVCPGFCLVLDTYLSLCKNTEWISMKFATGNHYHQQIKWLHFGGKLEQGRGSRIWQNIRIDVNRCCRDVKQLPTPSEWLHQFQRQNIRIDVNWCCHNIKQLPTPSEWLHQFHCTDMGDAILDTISR